MPVQRRKHLRLPLESTTFIEMPSPRLSQRTTERMITCKTLDVSRGGLQVILAEELMVGAILQINIEMPGAAEGELHIAGEVRWCLQNKDAQYPWIAGFQLLNAENTDVDQWIALITLMEN
jgi:hypothetical protein